MKKFTKIKCGKLYDGLKAKLQENMEILIEGEKIIEVDAISHVLKIQL
jgi:hypothetical protein